jgi:class 3 adenylate cyclase
VTGTSSSAPSPNRYLATVLFVDIVESTAAVSTIGDARWSQMLDAFTATAERCADAERGELIGVTGDGVVAVFDGPGRALRAACELRDALAPLGIEIRAGVHTAEIERRGGDIAGIGVHSASRVADVAEPGAVWVSRTVTDLVGGCGLAFEPRGEHHLEGVPDPWTLYEVAV